MSSVIDNEILFKRQHKGRVYKDVTKRVSFDENALSDQKIKELGVLHGTKVTRNEYLDMESIKRYFDSCQEAEKCDFETCKRRENLMSIKSESPRHLPSTPTKKKIDSLEFPPFVERGVPEGQEDPKKYLSTSNLTECGKESQSLKDFMSVFGFEKPNIAKAHLVRRFLRSIPSKTRKKFVLHQPAYRTWYVRNIKNYESVDYSSVTSAIKDELKRNSQNETNPLVSLNPSLMQLVSPGDHSVVYKVYNVLTVDNVPVLAVITSDSLCVVGYSPLKNDFVLLYSCCFANLLAAVLGPFSQILIVLNDKKHRFFTHTDDSVASALITHLEIAMRRWCNSRKKEFNFNVAQISDLKYMSVFHNVLPDSAFSKDEILVAQFSVWLQEDYTETTDSPCGPRREGYLMARIGVATAWSPTYLCLKGGVLYIFEKNTDRVPKFAIPLQSIFYKGCRIHNNAKRPHSFEIILDRNSSFNFGAADETEMIEWIRDLHASAFQVSDNIPDVERNSSIVNCFVTLSTNQILLHRFPNEIISRALLSDVTTFRRSNRPESYYCLLELSCREASEMSGDWILYFVSESSYQQFCSKFNEITDCLFLKETMANLPNLLKNWMFGVKYISLVLRRHNIFASYSAIPVESEECSVTGIIVLKNFSVQLLTFDDT